MRRLALLFVALLSVATVHSQDLIRYYPPASVAGLSSSGTELKSTLPLEIYNSPSTTEYANFYWSSNEFFVQITGANRMLNLSTPNGGWSVAGTTGNLSPSATDSKDIGVAATLKLAREIFLTRGFQGSKSKALTGGSPTTFLRVAVAQTAGANYGGGSVGYTVYATDGTDSQSLVGEVYFAMVNKAGAETCAIGEVGTPVLSQSSGSTLACTFTCATAAADTVDIAANCTSGLVETTFTIEYRGNMQKTNTYTPQ